MSDEQNQTTDAQTTPPSPPSETESPQENERIAKLSREAANYRRQLREAQAERDSLKEAVSIMRRDGIAAALAGLNHNGLTSEAARDVAAALTDEQLAELYPTGSPDADAVAALAAEQLKAHPYMSRAGSPLVRSRARPTGGTDPTARPRGFDAALADRFGSL
ncbi:hypothetical protein [Bifidobacterium leontopitheci]|uniref:Scaffolding protein n=1 Tax=Bifidobacterium leontopitheci TaxID=2650774 RepID=A0A6I1GMJ5_9BIFI|nr:hypothetical protein [Bifidobacterium leontopitheci]KAB7790557.1 hypothetical protein F7D09_0926 [Bifidobacterium leontopitheci]